MRDCDMFGNSHCKNGSMKREECCEECESLDAEKISTIHTNTGSQNFRKALILDTLHENRNRDRSAIRM